MKEYFATKELLMREYEGCVRASLVATYFGRAALLLLLCLVAFIDLKVTLVVYAVIGASVLVSMGWFFELWAAERSKRLIRRQIGKAEEGFYDERWEDANIRIGYFRSYWRVHRMKSYFVLIEPVLWIYLIGIIIFFQGK